MALIASCRDKISGNLLLTIEMIASCGLLTVDILSIGSGKSALEGGLGLTNVQPLPRQPKAYCESLRSADMDVSCLMPSKFTVC